MTILLAIGFSLLVGVVVLIYFYLTDKRAKDVEKHKQSKTKNSEDK